ncbi:MAG: FtsX-like permease family protein [Kofleriaceae bacterium]
MLERKLRRDIWRLKGQVATIALVLACGVMAMIMLRSTFGSLIEARDAYYANYRLGDVFAHLERAPDAVASRLAAAPGIAVVYPRIVKPVMVPIEDELDPVTGTMISLPEGDPPLGRIYLRSGRMPLEGSEEAVILEQFATAHHLVPGDRLPVVIEGRLREIAICGIALSPEFVLASSRGGFVDARRFVVLWMAKKSIASAFQMDGAFNDVVIQLELHAGLAGVLDTVDRQLARYGGTHAFGRDKQPSNYMLTSELSILRTLALLIPAIFLGVAAFLVNVVISRLVFLERTQIAVLKALGFSNRRIGLHYLGLVALIVSGGAVLGVYFGVKSGGWMTTLYASLFRFPSFHHHVSVGLVVGTLAIGLGAAVIGALAAVRRVVRMAPAEAMRPPAPLTYRRSVAGTSLGRMLGPSGTMIVRELERQPLRFVMSVLGIAMGIAIFVMGRFGNDSFGHLMEKVYPREHQEDLSVQLVRSAPTRVVEELAHLPGVEYAEGQRMVGVRIHAGGRWRDIAIVGLPAQPQLRHLLDDGKTPVVLPADRIVVTDKLAEILGVGIGDEVTADDLEGDWRSHRYVIGGLVHEPFGLFAYMRADALARTLGEAPRVTSVLLRVDRDRAKAVRERLKQDPAVLGVTSTQQVIDAYRAQTGRSMVVMTLILTLSAAAIAIGIVYNNARIALSMRSRDLASLRVLGFTRREISNILLGELGLQVACGIPVGLYLGTLLSRMLTAGFDTETIRFPLYLSPNTYAFGALIALISGAVSALLVRRKLDKLDLVGVLKSSWE